MALTLPFPDLIFVPLDPLTAEEQNEIVANYTYIASQCSPEAYKVGETISFGAYNVLFGHISSSSSTVYLTLPLPRRATSTASATYTFSANGTFQIRGVSGYIINNLTWDSNYKCTVYCDNGNYSGNTYLRLNISKTDGTAFTGATNNTPVSVVFAGDVTITRTA